MKIWLLIAALIGLHALSAASQPKPLKPDLVISEASVTPQRVGVGEEFTYTVTVKNIGGAPC
ncbi:MAG: CARDB domain-containing protein [Reyranellales bacterium]